jgi:hypothetical protein
MGRFMFFLTYQFTSSPNHKLSLGFSSEFFSLSEYRQIEKIAWGNDRSVLNNRICWSFNRSDNVL